MQLVAAIGADQQQALVAQAPHQRREELERRAVRPVQVLDREEDGRLGGQPIQQRAQQPEESRLGQRLAGAGHALARLVGAVGRVELGQQPREVRRRWARRSSSKAAGSSSRARPRSAAAIGAYGMPSAPKARQSPRRTRAPRATARRSSSRSSRVLPTPDSPPTNTAAARAALGRVRAPPPGGRAPRHGRRTRGSRRGLARRDYLRPRTGAGGGLHESQAVRRGGRLDARAHAEFGQDPRDVHAGGLLGDEQRLADLAVRVTLGHQGQDAELARGEPEAVEPRSLRARLPPSSPARMRARRASPSTSAASSGARRAAAIVGGLAQRRPRRRCGRRRPTISASPWRQRA